MTSDLELLQNYSRNGSQDAFAALVERHLNLVYSAALRQVRSPQLAEEISQSVFADLARNAASLKQDTILTAWLYQVTRRTAIDVIRRESRRQSREQIAVEINAMNATNSEWKDIEPLLDEAVLVLDEPERAAILMRYFEDKSLREVGQQLGISEDAAQKRVSRAVDRLREFFTKRGVAVSTTGLVAVISAHSVQAAPTGLSLAISTTALNGISVTSTAIATTKVIAMTTLQKTLITVTLAAFAGVGVYEARQAAQMQEQNQKLQSQSSSLDAQVQQLVTDHDSAKRQLDALAAENASLRSNSNAQEISRLRAQVKQLQATQPSQASADSNDPFTRSVMALSARASDLYQHLQQMPDKSIPELALLDTSDWIRAAQTAKFDTDEDIRRSLQKLRALAKNKVPIGSALFAYAAANNGELPTDLAQLQHFFNRSNNGDFGLDDATFNAIISRYQLLHTGKAADYPRGTWLVAEKAPVDKEYDSRAKFGLGTSSVFTTGIGESGDPEDPSYGSTTP